MSKVNLNVKTSILPGEVMYFMADVNYTVIYYLNRTEIISVPLKKVEEKLKSYSFCRIHKSCLINMDFISDRKTTYLVEMKDKSLLRISRRKSSTFKKYLKQIKS